MDARTNPNSEWLFSQAAAELQLPDGAAGLRYHSVFAKGSMSLELYAPRGRDEQIPHRQDELYIVVAGSGDFIKNRERRRFGVHDVIFVEAGAEHRFVDFTDDFAAWVVFWGPDGGESEYGQSPG